MNKKKSTTTIATQSGSKTLFDKCKKPFVEYLDYTGKNMKMYCPFYQQFYDCLYW